ncbi:dihydroorotate dehydrogenase [Paenisporosarcina antarctica]|uniref:Dihydroorotate dehydrogenase n=1 Tax=Paenisporosarcina antarctica TaxID=417367 RepID=A0A4P6ZZQ1_9BACL|nr:dihydroorotate dehydrogenase [Paenisporosarcina antarctica]QBP41982.1 dihydroorotate dehydrogenase [Paenisporosarcina antarctica]
MPDWSYHVLFKPISKKLPPPVSREFIHSGMTRIASLPGGGRFINFLGREESSVLVQREIQDITFPNPVGLSGKIDPLLTGSKAFSNLGFGFIEVGPVTKNSVTDATTPSINYTKQMIEFSPHYESIGIDQTLQQLKKWKPKQPLLIRLAGTVDEQVEMLEKLDMYADAFVVQSTSFERFHHTSNKPIYLAVPVNQVEELPIEQIQTNFSGVVLDEQLNQSSEENLSKLLDGVQFLRAHHFELPILTVGGINEPADALSLLGAGASLVLLSGGYVLSGPGLTKRINEALLSEVQPEYPTNTTWIWYWLFGLMILTGGFLALLFSLTSIILPYDEQFLGMERDEILLFNERILFFMAHDRMTLAGTMISGGIVYMSLARYGVRNGLLWAKQAIDLAAIIGFMGIFLFIGYGYFDWLHLIFWLILLPFYIVGFIKTRHLNGTPSSFNTRNHVSWRRSLFGQLAFVTLGFSFILGGIIISFVGVTKIFVPTDLLYICMSPEMLHAFNERLLSVIAHDRAGFGSALLSVGFLVLTLSLWGFQQGNKWVWWTLLIGGLPAFAAAISIHLLIGYTTFIHLLPAYFALSLFIIGLVTTYRFFHMREVDL